MKFVETFSWIGLICILTAYALVSFSALSSATFLYFALNAVGSLGILLSAFKKKDLQAGTLNVLWLIIAIVGIIHLFK